MAVEFVSKFAPLLHSAVNVFLDFLLPNFSAVNYLCVYRSYSEMSYEVDR